eukprot:TRINITY_DN14949_c0_g1_i2.p3 TRINITY_DN14949_c0_g1~~TRINITY_DN14949_c0_g1_i2.p3  ORF type:complete len:131 (-),score=22.02 TRINITY_DN14949_c0_g1_i2:93-485(-)
MADNPVDGINLVPLADSLKSSRSLTELELWGRARSAPTVTTTVTTATATASATTTAADSVILQSGGSGGAGGGGLGLGSESESDAAAAVALDVLGNNPRIKALDLGFAAVSPEIYQQITALLDRNNFHSL